MKNLSKSKNYKRKISCDHGDIFKKIYLSKESIQEVFQLSFLRYTLLLIFILNSKLLQIKVSISRFKILNCKLVLSKFGMHELDKLCEVLFTDNWTSILVKQGNLMPDSHFAL